MNLWANQGNKIWSDQAHGPCACACEGLGFMGSLNTHNCQSDSLIPYQTLGHTHMNECLIHEVCSCLVQLFSVLG
jgi:hypothetical protein